MSRSLARSTITVGGATLASRLAGFARDVVLARVFGAGAETDAFFVAFKIPNFMRRLFAEGALSQAFVPVLADYKVREGGALRDCIDHVAGSLGAVLLVITLVGVAAAPLVIGLFAPGFVGDPGKFGLAVDMLRLTFPYLLLISLTAFAGGILNSHGRFALPALTPLLLNFALIGAALWLAPRTEPAVLALAWGVLIAGIAQLLVQGPALARLGLLPRPRLARGHEGVRRIMRLMLPALFGVSVTQINLLIDTIIASFLVSGSVTWLYYADRLMEFPLGVFAIALGTVILPNLSGLHVKRDLAAFSATLDWALRLVVLLALPAAVGLIVLAGPILATLFGSAEFGSGDVARTAEALAAYGVGLVGFTLVKVLAPGFYARQDTRTPVRIGVIAMAVNVVGNLTLVWFLQHAGLALATSIAAWVNGLLLLRGLRRAEVYRPAPGWKALALRALFANAAMAGVLVGLAGATEVWGSGTTLARGAWLAAILFAGVVTYFAALALAGGRVRHFRQGATD